MIQRELKGPVSIIVFILFSIVILSSSSAAKAENRRESSPEYVFYKGNTFYEEGEYDDAINEYSKLLSTGKESGSLYYNLGNSYFKKGEPGRAILYYERAKRLIPRDSDLKSNHRFALSQIKYNVSEKSAPWFKRALAVFNALSINEMTIILSALFTGIVLLLIVRLYVPLSRRYSVLFVSGLLIILVIIAFSLFNRISLLDEEAVIVTESPEAGFEPFESATIHFTLYEGMKVQIVQSKKDWLKIRRSDGKAGWVKNEDVEKIM